MKIVIGIDPGSKGYICASREGNVREYLSILENTPRDIANFLAKYALSPIDDVVCVMEEVHAIYGSSAKATFSFGEIFGLLKGLMIAYGLPYHLVQPKDWQKEIWINDDKVYESGKKIDTKKTSINAARRLFPMEDFRRTEKCKNLDDNKVDATLISEFGRRLNL